MRLKKYIGVALVVLATATSCQKDFLDRAPESNISDAEFWKTQNDMQLYVNNFYNNYLPTYDGFQTQGIYGLDADQGSDNMIKMAYDRNNLNGERTVPTSGGGWSWGNIRNINYFLTNYEKSPENFEKIQQYVGEALYFRSLLYFDMMKNFGDLPWIDKPLTPADKDLLQAPRLSRSIIADNIIADLDKATQYLPAKGNSRPNRVYKEVAMALQTRIALYEGTWEKYHAGTPFGVTGSNGDKYLQKAAATAEAIIATGTFALDNTANGKVKGYWSLFNNNDYTSSKEIMFWRRYDVAANRVNKWAAYGKLGNGRGLTKSLVDDYLATDGLPISASPLYKGDATLIDVVTNRDPRLNQVIYVNDGNHVLTNNRPGVADEHFLFPSFNAAATEDKNSTGYQNYKGTDPNYAKQLNLLGDAGLIFFRYAEVLLNLAEAKAELGTLTQADVDATINKLRARVGMPGLVIGSIIADPNWKFPALSPVINEVRRERRVELAAEGFRHDDIWRWAAADELIVGWKPLGAKKAQFVGVVTPAAALNTFPANAAGYIELYQNVGALANGYQFKINRDYLLPIPLDQITLVNYKQNPGW